MNEDNLSQCGLDYAFKVALAGACDLSVNRCKTCDAVLRTSYASSWSYDDIHCCLFWKLITSLYFDRTIDSSNDCVAVLRECSRTICTM
jgi:hypothetical protein